MNASNANRFHEISMTTDYGGFPDDVRAYADKSLAFISAAGFRHIHWCQYWSGDYIYDVAEIEWIAETLRRLGLSMNDLHAPDGKDKHLGAPERHRRRAGVGILRNRVDMAVACDCDTVIIHCPGDYDSAMDVETAFDRLSECLDEACDYAVGRGVRIALENACTDNFPVLMRAFERFPAEALGLCYDSGHGNIAGNGLDRLAACADRLIALHLHDNDGENDQHKLPLTGTIDWPELMGIIARSAYDKPAITMEVSMGNHRDKNLDTFMRRAGENCTAILGMCVA